MAQWIGGVLGVLRLGFNSQPGTVGEGSGIATDVLKIRSICQRAAKKGKKKKRMSTNLSEIFNVILYKKEAKTTALGSLKVLLEG